MTNELTFTTNSLFENVTLDKYAENWTFSFANNVHVSSTGFWRLLVNNKIVFVSIDNGHQFGLPSPLDLVEELIKELAGKILTKIEVIKDTFDLTLTLTDELKLDIYISSSGYETYDFSINNKRYIGLGSGDIAIFDS
ncbi:hypothetical protein [Mucilaginibacter sp.]|uniref:hypothetical protein n=1 Tax=Mucilaginibacter sp. TaxID=1882438 RepID=UPI003B007228